MVVFSRRVHGVSVCPIFSRRLSSVGDTVELRITLSLCPVIRTKTTTSGKRSFGTADPAEEATQLLEIVQKQLLPCSKVLDHQMLRKRRKSRSPGSGLNRYLVADPFHYFHYPKSPWGKRMEQKKVGKSYE